MSGIKNVLITAGLNFGIFGYTAWNNGKSSKSLHRSTSELFKIYEVKPDMQPEDRVVEARQRTGGSTSAKSVAKRIEVVIRLLGGRLTSEI